MFLAQLFAGFCTLALIGQGLCFNVRREDKEKNSKYVVYNETKTWDDARNFCDENNQALAFIMTYQDQKDLRTFIETNNLLPKDETSGYWLGARAEEKIWRWEFNEEDPRDDDNFMAGWHWYKPDNTKKAGECMELQYINTNKFTRSLSWNNLRCDEKRGFVCQNIESYDDVFK